MTIKTAYWRKPIPTDRYDWEAIDDQTYDGPGSPIGYGATEADAIADLQQQVNGYAVGDIGTEVLPWLA